MPDIIKLLPDSIANQIAAGEVIQRPASVVKELLENSVDSGARQIQLIVKDSGKTLIQVVDDGCGMSETDARMSLERHATSKISNADDLFRIKTMGFRGEALASIAAVAQMEIKTRSADREVGTEIVTEGSRVKHQEMCACPIGTSISVKNLFYNVPARRKFLKGDAVELRHIIDEFERVALVNEKIEFRMFHNDQQLFLLPASNLRQRIIGILGKSYNEKLVPLEEQTDLVMLTGFIGKPETARKGRGEQFLFVNGRYFRSSYFHAAMQQAFEGLVPQGHHPSYFIYFNVDPATIDVNIHPTKTEIKFEDERSIFAILRSTVKRSLGQYHISPSLDFERDELFDILPPKKGTEIRQPVIHVDPTYNPFETGKKQTRQDWERGKAFQKSSTEGWENLYKGLEADLQPSGSKEQTLELTGHSDPTVVRQIGLRYVLVQSEEGIFLLHQYRAHTRILFEDFEHSLVSAQRVTQQELFPVTLELSPQDSAVLKTVIEPLALIGFDIEELGPHAFIIRGIPAACINLNIEEAIGGFMDDLRENRPSEDEKLRQHVLRSMAQQSAIKSGKELKAQEMMGLFHDLMKCKQPRHDLNGKPTFVLMNTATLDKLFNG